MRREVDMSIRRLLLTAAAMAAIAMALTALAPPFPAMAEALTDPQRTVDRAGADTLVLAGAGLLAWLCWAWGALGLALTAASGVPGLLGCVARAALYVVLPAGARRSAALLLGLGLGVTGPVLGTLSPSAPAAAAAVTVGTPGPADSPIAAFADRAGTPAPPAPGAAAAGPGGAAGPAAWPIAAFAARSGTPAPERPGDAVPAWPAPGLAGGPDDVVPDWPEEPAPGTAPDPAPAQRLGSHV